MEEDTFVMKPQTEGGFYMDSNNFVNVKTGFGAYGDGIADDSGAIQNALDCVRENGGTVFFPVGIYRIDKCVLYYSNQRLIFENGATLLRGGAEQRYLLGNYTDAGMGGYTATHNVDIIGATFDGCAEIDFNATLLNNSHSRDLRIRNCKFKNGNTWHFYECNSSEYVTVDNCIFEGSMKGGKNSEFIQLDGALPWCYETTEICPDMTVCRHIVISNCKFECSGFSPAIGNHGDFPHNNIRIHGNVFLGNSGPRGNINFVRSMYAVDIYNNTFENSEVGIILNSAGRSSTAHDNRFTDVAVPMNENVIGYNNFIDGRLG